MLFACTVCSGTFYIMLLLCDMLYMICSLLERSFLYVEKVVPRLDICKEGWMGENGGLIFDILGCVTFSLSHRIHQLTGRHSLFFSSFPPSFLHHFPNSSNIVINHFPKSIKPRKFTSIYSLHPNKRCPYEHVPIHDVSIHVIPISHSIVMVQLLLQQMVMVLLNHWNYYQWNLMN